MRKQYGANKYLHPEYSRRVLCVGTDAESREAFALLKNARVSFSSHHVPRRKVKKLHYPKPPCLLMGKERFSGISRIKEYVSSLQRTKAGSR